MRAQVIAIAQPGGEGDKQKPACKAAAVICIAALIRLPRPADRLPLRVPVPVARPQDKPRISLHLIIRYTVMKCANEALKTISSAKIAALIAGYLHRVVLRSCRGHVLPSADDSAGLRCALT